MLITEQDMKEAFDPVIDEVIKLVKHQIESVQGAAGANKVSAVLLVGGFGESRYLKKRLEDAIQPISLICPPNGFVIPLTHY